ncbi:MAG: hypothetical protein IT292_07055 [Deltaproteobacteria bacterium]|nr:hypothetical protein [Deltaproteobacteria bacterium]
MDEQTLHFSTIQVAALEAAGIYEQDITGKIAVRPTHVFILSQFEDKKTIWF